MLSLPLSGTTLYYMKTRHNYVSCFFKLFLIFFPILLSNFLYLALAGKGIVWMLSRQGPSFGKLKPFDLCKRKVNHFLLCFSFVIDDFALLLIFQRKKVKVPGPAIPVIYIALRTTAFHGWLLLCQGLLKYYNIREVDSSPPMSCRRNWYYHYRRCINQTPTSFEFRSCLFQFWAWACNVLQAPIFVYPSNRTNCKFGNGPGPTPAFGQGFGNN